MCSRWSPSTETAKPPLTGTPRYPSPDQCPGDGDALLRRPLLRAAAWLYPAATSVDVLATANHYLLNVITAPGVALLPRFARRLGLVHGGSPRCCGPLAG